MMNSSSALSRTQDEKAIRLTGIRSRPRAIMIAAGEHRSLGNADHLETLSISINSGPIPGEEHEE
jgi:hypothetical protein